MRHFRSVEEGFWFETKIVQLTKQQMELLKSEDEINAESKNALLEYMASQREVEVSENDATSLTLFYNINKPVLKDGDVYELISIDLTETRSKNYKGILNCRVNGEHTQVRF